MTKEKQTYGKKRYKKSLRTQVRSRYAFWAVLLCILSIFGISIVHIYNQVIVLPREVIARPDVKVIPPEIKKELQHVPIAANIRIPVLMYHYVEYVKDKKDTIRQSLDITPYMFELQLQTLQQAGYTFLTMADLADVLDGKNTLPPRPVVLTFDDGYRDFYTDVFPLLKKYKVKATAYVVPGFFGGKNYLTDAEVDEISQNSLIELAAHTMHHVWLKKMPFDKAKKEIIDSKVLLEAEIHKPVVSFAYPYGAFDAQAIAIVKGAGFKTAVSTIPGIEIDQANRYFIFRLRPGGRTGDTLLHYLEHVEFRPYK